MVDSQADEKDDMNDNESESQVKCISATTAISHLQDLQETFPASGKYKNVEARCVLASSVSEADFHT